MNLTSIQRDVLKEIGNIGAGNAATSMSKLINKKVEMQIPAVDVVSYDEMMELIGGPDELIVAILFRIQGETPGTVYFILTTKEAGTLVSQLTDEVEFDFASDGPANELAISVLQEMGNILTGSYLAALSDFTNINMQPSVPYLSVDMAGAILTAGLLELSQVTDSVTIIDTKINSNLGDGIHGNLLLLPDPESFPKIFNALGIDKHE
ncbi:chemotaxis protein CheC [Virgibacillus natechei]|uniref:Chemotaxis protein CheC n=1 Tax=Virgibacillus natechei TaxID=1216297 RepID=A0ABS4IDH4_9BACI|nr:chemotaxis protein CheC [Virgibacillus natechei]MBP1968079.1 chemotaxis protein CheC [Virgibacillus natechei]UZD14640.1 chemotaxis protein CheC [Virgibacillus natechei]